MLVGSAFIKGAAEEISHVVLDTHGGKHNTELLVGILAQRRLLYQLGCQLIMGKSVP